MLFYVELCFIVVFTVHLSVIKFFCHKMLFLLEKKCA